MAAVVNLKAENLVVEPGKTATAELSLLNAGTIVEQFTILMLGEASGWTVIDPPVVSLFPQAQQVVRLRFSPPRAHTTPSGVNEFAVKVIPSNEPEESVVEEGVITVGSFNDVGAELVPRVTTARLHGRQRLAVDSRGNVPVPVMVTAVDAAEALKFKIRPSKITTAPGEARFAKIRVKPRQRHWKGPPQQKPYKVQVAPEGEKPLVLDGSLTQKAVIPKWLLALLALALALLLLWFLVLRPIVKSTAVNANAAALAAQQAQTRNLAGQLAATKSSVAALSGAKPGSAAAAAAAATTTATTAAGTTSTATTVAGTSSTAKAGATTASTALPPVTGPDDGDLEVSATAGSATPGTNQLPVLGAGSSMSITDLIVMNETADDAGTVQVLQLTPQTGGKATLKKPLLVQNLANVTNEDYRFNTPIVIPAGSQLGLSLSCTTSDFNDEGGGGGSCQVGVFYSENVTQPQPTTTTSIPGP